MNLIRNLYIHERFFKYISIIAATFLVSFWFPILYMVAWFMVTILGILFIGDIYLLFNVKEGIYARRILSKKFSNSDQNPIPITVKNKYNFKVEVKTN